MGYLSGPTFKGQPLMIDLLKYLVNMKAATITWDDGLGADSGFAAPVSDADKAILISANDDLSGANAVLSEGTVFTDLIHIDLGALYRIQYIYWRARIYVTGGGGTAKKYGISDDDTNWDELASLVIGDPGADTVYSTQLMKKYRYLHVQIRTTMDTREFFWGKMAIIGEADQV